MKKVCFGRILYAVGMNYSAEVSRSYTGSIVYILPRKSMGLYLKSGNLINFQDDEKLGDNDSTCTEESADDDDSDHGNIREARQPTTASAGSRRSESRHQGAIAATRSHSARKRRQIRRKKKRYQVPVRLVPGESVCVEVDSTSKLLSVTWQDGSVEENIPSTEVLPVLHVDELEFFPGEFVIDKSKTFVCFRSTSTILQSFPPSQCYQFLSYAKCRISLTEQCF